MPFLAPQDYTSRNGRVVSRADRKDLDGYYVTISELSSLELVELLQRKEKRKL